MNSWNEHVKKYQKEHNISYKVALQESRETYYEQKQNPKKIDNKPPKIIYVETIKRKKQPKKNINIKDPYLDVNAFILDLND